MSVDTVNDVSVDLCRTSEIKSLLQHANEVGTDPDVFIDVIVTMVQRVTHELDIVSVGWV